MPKPEENYHLTEIVVLVITLGGVALAVGQGLMGKPFWDSASQALMAFITGGLILLTIQGWRSGKLGIKGGNVYRHQNPIGFWVFLIFYGVVSVGFLLVTIIFIVI